MKMRYGVSVVCLKSDLCSFAVDCILEKKSPHSVGPHYPVYIYIHFSVKKNSAHSGMTTIKVSCLRYGFLLLQGHFNIKTFFSDKGILLSYFYSRNPYTHKHCLCIIRDSWCCLSQIPCAISYMDYTWLPCWTPSFSNGHSYTASQKMDNPVGLASCSEDSYRSSDRSHIV